MENQKYNEIVLAINPELSKSIKISTKEDASEISTFSYGTTLKSSEESTLEIIGFYHSLGFVVCSQTWFETIRLKAVAFLKSNIENYSLFTN